MTETTNPTPAEPLQFVDLVKQAFEQKNIKPKCPCGCIGWANFEIFPVPTITPTLAQNVVIYSALITCLKCGLKVERNLNVLGLTFEIEQRRIVTPDQVRQQDRQRLVMP